jgi:hypothetical protein
MPEPELRTISNRRLFMLLLLGSLSVPAFVLFQRGSNGLSDAANIWAGWISASFMTAVLFISFRRRQKAANQMTPRSMVAIAVGLVLLSGLITTVSIAAFPSKSILEIAQSSVPLSEIYPEQKRIVVELVRQTAANSAANIRDAQTMKPISPALYSVDSFASKAIMESTLSQLQEAYRLDQAYAASRRQSMQIFHDKMLKADPDYLRDFESKTRQSDSYEKVLETSEHDWVVSTTNLYNYAIAHADQISLDHDGHLNIRSQEVRQSVLQQIDACRSEEQTLSLQREKAVNDQEAIQNHLAGKDSD